MAKVLIATLYNPDPVLLSANKLGPDRLVLLIDPQPNLKQQESLDLINKSLGRVLDVKVIKTEVYDIVKIAEKAVEVMDMQPKEDDIFVNITSGRKTKAIGLLFAAYARSKRIKKIVYYPEEESLEPILLPKLSYNLTESQKRLLEFLDGGQFRNILDLSRNIDISRPMLYRNIKELEEMGLVEDLKLTDAGKIARL